jgi:hypothetical protein
MKITRDDIRHEETPEDQRLRDTHRLRAQDGPSNEWLRARRGSQLVCPKCQEQRRCKVAPSGTRGYCQRPPSGSNVGPDGYWDDIAAETAGRVPRPRRERRSSDIPTLTDLAIDDAWRAFFAELPLADHHKEILRERAITPEKNAVFCSWPDESQEGEARRERALEAAREALRKHTPNRRAMAAVPGILAFQHRGPGMILPMIEYTGWQEVSGKPGTVDHTWKIGTVVFRPDNPGPGGAKYLFARGKNTARVHVTRPFVGLNGERISPHGAEGDAGRRIWITEGVLKSYAIRERWNEWAVGAPGVSSQHDEIVRVVALVARYMETGPPSEIVIAFDADAETNEAVGKARERLTRKLQTVGYPIVWAKWALADGKGIDDLLVAGKSPTFETKWTPPPRESLLGRVTRATRYVSADESRTILEAAEEEEDRRRKASLSRLGGCRRIYDELVSDDGISRFVHWLVCERHDCKYCISRQLVLMRNHLAYNWPERVYGAEIQLVTPEEQAAGSYGSPEESQALRKALQKRLGKTLRQCVLLSMGPRTVNLIAHERFAQELDQKLGGWDAVRSAAVRTRDDAITIALTPLQDRIDILEPIIAAGPAAILAHPWIGEHLRCISHGKNYELGWLLWNSMRSDARAAARQASGEESEHAHESASASASEPQESRLPLPARLLNETGCMCGFRRRHCHRLCCRGAVLGQRRGAPWTLGDAINHLRRGGRWTPEYVATPEELVTAPPD